MRPLLATLALLTLCSSCGLGQPTPCVPSTCAALGATCGAVGDGCGQALDCGACPAGQTCGGGGAPNVCVVPGCTPELAPAFCARLGKACGSVTAADTCGVERTLDCGGCDAASGQVCGANGQPNVCGVPCVPEEAAALCARKGKGCGSYTGQDNCGASRTVDCGGCNTAAGEVCGANAHPNVCGVPCVPEADTAVCARHQKTCGRFTGQDNCGASRTVECGATCAQGFCGGGGVPNVCGSGGPISVGPFKDFLFYRNPCGDQLWARWTNSAEFWLGERTVTAPGGQWTKSTFSNPGHYLPNYEEVELFNDSGLASAAGVYQADLTVESPNGAVLTHTLKNEAKEGLYKDARRFTFVSARLDVTNGLTVTVTPKFSGSVSRIISYWGANTCAKVTKTFYTTPSLTNGVTTQLTAGGTPPTGSAVVLVLQGMDTGLGYSFYGTVEFTMP